jgi:hypothetical protein
VLRAAPEFRSSRENRRQKDAQREQQQHLKRQQTQQSLLVGTAVAVAKNEVDADLDMGNSWSIGVGSHV